MIIDSKLGKYRWVEDWAKIPATPSGKENGRTHGVVASKSGKVFVFHQATPSVLVYDRDGRLLSSWGVFPGAHGMTIIEEGGSEYLWLTDQTSSRVVKTTLDGREVMSLPHPDHQIYKDGKKRYVPTWAAQNPQTGEIWVGDGYGAHLAHKFSPDGRQQMTIDGSEGAGPLREPHGVNFCRGAKGMELFITDRANHRIVVYDGNGKFLRSSMAAHSPCCFGFLGDQVVVPELFTGVKILDKDSLKLIDEIGANDRVKPNPDGGWWPPAAPEGWPNLAGTEHIRPGVFNSPHGACFAPNGDIYVVEWIIGGRITKLEKQ
jgi:hypothetical protein